MFEEVLGLPTHVLVVHAAVVFVPLLALAAVAYALVPRLRSRIGWAAALLAVAGPGAALIARLSGQELEKRLIAANYGPDILAQVNDHQGYGNLTFWFSLALGVGTGLLVLVTSGRFGVRLPSWLTWLLGAAVVALAGVTSVYVYLTGESGAEAVWGGVV